MPIRRPTLPRFPGQICCPEIVSSFVNQSESNIPYAQQFGEKPFVTVLYNVDGVWTAAGVLTNIQLEGNPVENVHIDHGGPATGIIKLS